MQDTISNSLAASALPHNRVHVWWVALLQPSDVIAQLAATLSGEEHERADRFQFNHLRESFIVARGTLRLLLAQYVQLEPGEIHFEYTPAGKPFLSRQSNIPDISFNVSHSNGLVLYAIAKNRQVGIDVEYIRHIPDFENISATTFSAFENNQLQTIDDHQKMLAFFYCWTRKEAFIKASGDGMSFPLDQFDVSLRPDEPARLLRVFGSEEKARRWSMFGWQPSEEYAAAVVVEGTDCSVTYRQWHHNDRARPAQESG